MQYHNIPSPLMLALAATFALAGCNSGPEPMNIGTLDPMADELANAKPVELPPMLKESGTYRCKDNSLVFLSFMTDDKTVQLKTEKDGAITKLKAAEVGEPAVSADGETKVEGTGATVTVTMPGKSAQSCKS